MMHNLLGTAVSAIRDRRCLVIGTSPQFTNAQHDACIVVNGGIGRVTGKPTLHVVSQHLLVADTISRRHTLEQFRGRHVDVLAISGHLTSAGVDRLRSIEYGWNTMVIIPHGPGGEIVSSVCEECHDKIPGLGGISTGIFSVCLALWLGASEVVMTGFSLSPNGHFYNPDAPRGNIEADSAVLRMLAKHQGARLSTTSDELNTTFELHKESTYAMD